jgi:CheY-like chemotaxis protein
VTEPILVVDDDPALLEVVTLILNSEGYAVVTASNGMEALTEIERARPAVVLLDMRMPVCNGWEFAQRLHQRGIALPIVAMTAAQDGRQWAEEIGAAAYVPKPFDIGDLVTTVAQVTHDVVGAC